MPTAYTNGIFIFSKVEDGVGGAYYDIINSRAGGRTWDYHHWFASIEEMNEYAREHGC